MQETWLIRGGNRDLVIFMLGWSATPNAVRHIRPAGCDVLACCRYTELRDFQPGEFCAYRRIYLFAWSFGVWAAERCCSRLPLYKAVAYNGTPFPVHDRFGMHPRVVQLTLRGLSRVGMKPFLEKTYGSAQAVPQGDFPERSLEENIAELGYLAEQSAQNSAPSILWNKAYIAAGDAIFPPAAMRAYWGSAGLGTGIAGPHYPFADPRVVLDEMEVDQKDG